MNPAISIIIPLYNEEKVFGILIERLNGLIEKLPYKVEVVLVNDGSTDMTPDLMAEAALADEKYKAVFLSRNYGHQIAVSAGMANASATKAVMIIDGDLQDPPEMITTFYDKIKEGYEVVFAVRKKRKENFLKKWAYWAFYRLLNSISQIDIPLDSGDFCMISRRVNNTIVNMPERSRFIRGMRTWVGFKQIGIPYERDARVAGHAKYNFRMLFRLAYDGIFNFSDVPLRLITKLGLLTIIISIVYIIFVLVLKIMGTYVPQGFITIIVAIALFSGVQLVCLGIIGHYLSRIYNQVKERPLFIIDRIIEGKKEKPFIEI
jgi:polyisoprenyl-phosphate glycosyltransferase